MLTYLHRSQNQFVCRDADCLGCKQLQQVMQTSCRGGHAFGAHQLTDAEQCVPLQPEDAAKGVNLRPPEFFVAGSASQRNIDSPGGEGPAVKRTIIPPVVIVSYGSMSTPTAHHFHHGAYALAQPDAFQVSYDNPPAGHAQKPMFRLCLTNLVVIVVCTANGAWYYFMGQL